MQGDGVWTLVAGALSGVRTGSRHEGGEMSKMDSEPRFCKAGFRLQLPLGQVTPSIQQMPWVLTRSALGEGGRESMLCDLLLSPKGCVCICGVGMGGSVCRREPVIAGHPCE